jgi:hypothetical protein
MKKEILIAIVIGFVLGLIITFGIWTANKSLQDNNAVPQAQENESQPIVNENSQNVEEKMSLSITSPQDNSLLDQEEIEITGKTSPSANIVILFEEGEEIIQADGQGEFKKTITLSGGANEITITAVDQDGNEASKVLNLVYSTAQI